MAAGLLFCLTTSQIPLSELILRPTRCFSCSHVQFTGWKPQKQNSNLDTLPRSCSLTPPSPSNIPLSKFISHTWTFHPAQGTKRVSIFIQMVVWVRGNEKQLLRSLDSSGVSNNHGSIYLCLPGHVCTSWSVKTSRRVPSTEPVSHVLNDPQKYFVFSLLFVLFCFLKFRVTGKTFPLSLPDVGSAADHTVEHRSSVSTVLWEQKGKIWTAMELGW